MKKILFTLLGLFLLNIVSAQNELQSELKSVVAEGVSLYKLENANELANKIFDSKYKGKDKMAGYFSYLDNANYKTVFYNAAEKSKIITSVSFDESMDANNAKADVTEREMTPIEKDLYQMNVKTLAALADETNYKLLDNTKFTLMLMNTGGTRKVFVISESTKIGTVVFGNDFVFDFDSKMNIVDAKPLHKNIAMVNYEEAAGRKNDERSSHTFVAAQKELPTSTDVAILLCHEKLTNWTLHSFIGEHYIFFWNYAAKEMQAIPKGDPNRR